MENYVILLRGINVGGKNKISMALLKDHLEYLGFSNVATYINSGNVILSSNLSATDIKLKVQKALLDNFRPDGDPVKVLVITPERLAQVVSNKPKGFGEEPGKYHSDVIFLMDIGTKEAMAVFDPIEGVDTIWPGNGVIYSQRLSALRAKSRLSKIMGTPAYKSMTIRNWNTTVKLLELSHTGHNGI